MVEDRFKDAPFYKQSKNERIFVIGLGGIGSNTIYNLYKTIPANYVIFDRDRIEEHNVGTQFYRKNTIGSNKALILSSDLNSFGIYSYNKIQAINSHWVHDYTPIMIICVDNMKIRKETFNRWSSQNDRELFIDGRMRANFYEVFVVQNNQE